MHSAASDGSSSIEEKARAAMNLGYDYIAITDHSKRLKMTNGLDEVRLIAQMEEIESLNSKLQGFRILKSSEVDILEDGSLDYSNEVLRRLDLVTASIHSHFSLSRARQTTRILRAMENPYFNVLGHPTGRLLLSRDPYPIDMRRILEAARQRHCALELNANPYRLDLGSRWCRMAKEMGVSLTVSTDAHSPGELHHMRFGIEEARRGWIEAADVLNTLPLPELLQRLRRLA
jgi:DNA polymerase (family 10)